MNFISIDFFKENFILPEVNIDNWVLHADLDSFYASVEVKLHPELKGKPVIVAPNPKMGAKRGVVLTCSYEAREFGVRSAMPISQAHKLCPDAEYSFTGFSAYKEESRKVMEIFSQYDEHLQRVSIDEAYLNVSDVISSAEGHKKVSKICEDIKHRVWSELSLPVSIGASHTKQIAKIASQLAKPFGTLVIPKGNFREVLDPLPLKIISGVGKKTYSYLQEIGYSIIGDVSKYEYSNLPNKNLNWIWLTVHGIKLKSHSRPSSRSHSKERTFREDVTDRLVIRKALRNLLTALLEELNFEFKTLTIKLRDASFRTITRSFSFDHYIKPNDGQHKRICLSKANELVNVSFDELKKGKFRLLGVKASNFKLGPSTQRSISEFM